MFLQWNAAALNFFMILLFTFLIREKSKSLSGSLRHSGYAKAMPEGKD